jgi:hypothetical protein
MNPQSPFNQGGQAPYQPQQQPVSSPFPQQAPQQMPQPGYTPLPPVQTPPLVRKPSKLWVILTFVFIFTTLAAIGGGVWALLNYFDQRDNVDSKVTTAVATAVKTQQDKDAADFLEKEKQPNRQFAGPDDYGRLSFDYPKTWSVYVPSDATGGQPYDAYFNPAIVPLVSEANRFALRVNIQTTDYDAALQAYAQGVQTGDLVSKSVTIDGQTGTRFDGSFSTDLKGSAVVFRIRDKTVTLRTDAQTFQGDFDALISTITFNK